MRDTHPLSTHARRHRDDQPVALGCSHEGESDAGVTGGRLDERRDSRTDLKRGNPDEIRLGPSLIRELVAHHSSILCILHHRVPDSVLHGACRIEVLELHSCNVHVSCFKVIKHSSVQNSRSCFSRGHKSLSSTMLPPIYHTPARDMLH